jgi:hypothetical protein
VPPFKVDDRQAAHADRAPAVCVKAFVVGSAMHGHPSHAWQQRRVGGLIVKLEDAEYAAHGQIPLAADERF